MDKILYTGKDLSEAGAYGFQVQGVTAPARAVVVVLLLVPGGLVVGGGVRAILVASTRFYKHHSHHSYQHPGGSV